MAHPRKIARIRHKEDVTVETLWDHDNACYRINMSSDGGNTAQVVILESDLLDRSKMIAFLHRFAKICYDRI